MDDSSVEVFPVKAWFQSRYCTQSFFNIPNDLLVALDSCSGISSVNSNFRCLRHFSIFDMKDDSRESSLDSIAWNADVLSYSYCVTISTPYMLLSCQWRRYQAESCCFSSPIVILCTRRNIVSIRDECMFAST